VGYEPVVAVIGDLAIRGAGSDDEAVEAIFEARGWSLSFEYPKTRLWVHGEIEARLRGGGGGGYIEFILSEWDTDWGPNEGELANAERDLSVQIDDIVGAIRIQSDVVEVDPARTLDDLVAKRAFNVVSSQLLFGVLPGDGVIPMMNIARLMR